MNCINRGSTRYYRNDLLNLLALKSDMDMALAYAMVFWPSFVIFENVVLFEYFDKNTYNEAKKNAKVSSDIEKFMNHRHLCEIFGNPYINSTPDQLNRLGDILKDIWLAKLNRDFPEKSFLFKLTRADENDRFIASITFWSR